MVSKETDKDHPVHQLHGLRVFARLLAKGANSQLQPLKMRDVLASCAAFGKLRKETSEDFQRDMTINLAEMGAGGPRQKGLWWSKPFWDG
ncbi:unnamed protein product [Effrenium voratum]|nr:unnamed protein product [Effrenium voratum]